MIETYTTLEKNAVEAIKLMKREASENIEVSEVLEKYISLYEGFILSVQSKNDKKIKSSFMKIKSLSRAYLEVSSSWDQEFLKKMNETEKLGFILIKSFTSVAPPTDN